MSDSRQKHTHGGEAGGRCICPRCDKTITHRSGVPCREEKCPDCGKRMLRECSEHHLLLLEKRKARRQEK